jgi:hypothetical protein
MTLYSPEHLEAIRADQEWRAELRKQFGRRANRVRELCVGTPYSAADPEFV